MGAPCSPVHNVSTLYLSQCQSTLYGTIQRRSSMCKHSVSLCRGRVPQPTLVSLWTVHAISIDKSRRVFYSAMPLRTKAYGGFMHVSYGSEGVHIKGDILMQRFITLLSLMLCAALAITASGPGQV